jgi:hypothetical protein
MVSMPKAAILSSCTAISFESLPLAKLGVVSLLEKMKCDSNDALNSVKSAALTLPTDLAEPCSLARLERNGRNSALKKVCLDLVAPATD